MSTHDDYRMIGGAGERAQAAGLVGAEWYKSPVPRATMKALMKREDAPAVRDTLLWFALIAAAGVWMALSWGQPGSRWPSSSTPRSTPARRMRAGTSPATARPFAPAG